MSLQIDRREIYRYMGASGEPDGALKALAEEALAQVMAAAVPRQVSRRVSLSLETGGSVRLGQLETASKSLYRHLEGCTEAFLFAATLGTGIDLLLRRSTLSGMGRTVAIQAAAAAVIEAFCDECEKGLAAAAEGLYLVPRFSPGYGDLPLSFQKSLLSFLESDRRIGLSVTASLMMVPSKSVSAVIGLTPDKGRCGVHTCAACGKRGCPFRRA